MHQNFDKLSLLFRIIYVVVIYILIVTSLLFQVLDRIKNLSNHVTVSCTWTGELTLSVKTELVTTKTYFTDLDVPQLDSEVKLYCPLESLAGLGVPGWFRSVVI